MYSHSMARVSAYMVSVAIDSWRRDMSSVGNGEQKILGRWVLMGVCTYRVVELNIYLIVSIGCQAKYGMNALW